MSSTLSRRVELSRDVTMATDEVCDEFKNVYVTNNVPKRIGYNR